MGSEFIDDKNKVVQVNLNNAENGNTLAVTTINPEPKKIVKDPVINALLTGQKSILDSDNSEMIKYLESKLGNDYKEKLVAFQVLSQKFSQSLTAKTSNVIGSDIYIYDAKRIKEWYEKKDIYRIGDFFIANVSSYISKIKDHYSQSYTYSEIVNGIKVDKEITLTENDLVYILLGLYSEAVKLNLFKDEYIIQCL